jgi:AraC-like DNA-binding protein
MEKYTSPGFLSGDQILASFTVETELEDAFVIQARQIVVANLGDFQFDVPSFCRLMTVSRPQLHRKLKALTCLSATQFIRKIRIGEAKKLLISGKDPIYRVADKCGFQTVPNFNRVFNEFEKMTPSEYRRQASPQQ